MNQIVLRCNDGMFEVMVPNQNNDDVAVYKFKDYEEAFVLALEFSFKLGVPVQNQHLVCNIDK
ncbi:MAG: hypothetical protein K0Q77_1901 [Anaerosporomusa subterranea]|jgi:hypothetical protein|nr:hypothetical protein [Anaerosporomusa subterranea]